MQKRWLSLSLCLLAFAGLANANGSGRPVLATTGMIADLAREIGGECVQVTGLMGPGVDPHLYQPSAADVRRFQKADLVLYNGLGLEGQLAPVLKRFGEQRATLAVAEAAVQRDTRGAIESASGDAPDPHVWMDARLWAQAIEPVRQALAEVAPDCGADLRSRAAQYHEQLLVAHEWMSQAIASIPHAQRILITAHDAFGYFGRAYGIDVEGIQGISTSAEPSVRDIQTIAETITEREVPAIFIESTINPRTIEAVMAAARARGQAVSIGGELYGDALGGAETAASSTLGLLMSNVRTITAALGGELPPHPAEFRP